MKASIFPSTQAQARGLRLKRLRLLAGLTRQDLLIKYNIKPNTLKSWEVGCYRGIPQESAKKMLAIYQQEGVICSLDWLMEGVGMVPNVIAAFTSLDQKQMESSSVISQSHIEREEKQILTELMVFRKQHDNSVDCIVSDDTMEPCFLVGDRVAGVACSETAIDSLIGKICIVGLQDGILLVRCLMAGTKPHHYSLQALNPHTTALNATLKNNKLQFAAEVIWVRRKNKIYRTRT